ncbi:MAG: DsrE family protein [Gammaproteobacteria bacterium]|nr:DsrE family protein [Gammaproteobacteria bacterium]MDE2346156.1 DsrE family protein [Gammaproteobacteria bacterium]
MRKFPLFVAALIGITLSSTLWAAPIGPWITPAIQSDGPMHPLPDAAYQPSKSKVYKAVFAVTRPSKGANDPDGGLTPVARAVNVFASAKVPLNHLRFVVLIYGIDASPMVLDNAHYKERFGTDNPNLKIIRELKAAGVKVVVCGQALAALGIEHSWVDPDVTIALSALSTMVILQDQGYALIHWG